MIHKDCEGQIVLDCSGIYTIQSPSMVITPKGITPGMIQIDACKDKKGVKLICSKCGEVFSTKDDFENKVLEECGICRHGKSPSKIRVTEYISRVCDDCIERVKVGKINTSRKADQILSYFGEVLQKLDAPTLLTILMKK